MPVPRSSHEEHRGALTRVELPHERVELRRQVSTVVRLDVTERAREMLTPAKRSVDDEQIVVRRQAMAMH